MKVNTKINSLRICLIFAIAVLLTMTYGCEPERISTPPVVTIKAAINIDKTSATLTSEITPNSDKTNLVFEYSGPNNVWITKPVNEIFSGKEVITASVDLNGLSPDTKYNFRAKAYNTDGEASSDINSFTTNPLMVPVVLIKEAINISKTSATLVVEIKPNMDGTAIVFEYSGPDNIWIIRPIDTTFSGEEAITINLDLTNLIPDTEYNFRVRATNAEGEVYSEQRLFKTDPLTPPMLLVKETSNLNKTTATLNLILIPYLNETTVSFEYGDLDNIWTIKAISGTFSGQDSIQISLDISGLTPNMKYALVVKAHNADGASISDTTYFQAYAINDYDGNLYHTVTIGGQVWLKENLKTTHYANGDPISREDDLNIWRCHDYYYPDLQIYTYYNNDPELGKIYGALYDYKVGVDPRGLIPGWHTPTDNEFETLDKFINNGSNTNTGANLMEAGNTHWINVSCVHNDPFGFSALPNGAIMRDGNAQEYSFLYLNKLATFWGQSNMGDGSANNMYIPGEYCYMGYIGWGDQNEGQGLRLIKD